MEDRFKELMDGFRKGTLTRSEYSEWMEMVRSGDFDKEIGDIWTGLLAEEMENEERRNGDLTIQMEEIRKKMEADNRMAKGRPGTPARIRTLAWSSVAAAVLLLVSILIWWTEPPVPVMDVEVAQEIPEGQQYSGKQFIRLPDGSTALLNADSELSYGVDFGLENREVRLTGEAFFDVEHDPDHPFIVTTGSVHTRVLGTAFNVTAWPQQDEVMVTVERGKVSVGDDQEVYEELLPHEQITVDTETREFEKAVLDEEQEIEWKRTFFVLNQVSMKQAMDQIGERYNVEVKITNPALRYCIVNGAFLDNESLEHIVSVLCLAMNADYRIGAGSVEILGGMGCQAGSQEKN